MADEGTEDRDQEIAAELCARVEARNLHSYLGLSTSAGVEELADALAARRTRLQSQQANTKFRDLAMFVIKNHAAISRALKDPAAHLRHMERVLEADKLPLLELALDSVFADGVLSANEEAFVRGRALALGVSKETYERVLSERASARGIPIEVALQPPADATISGILPVGDAVTPPWWSPLFTRLLLDHIPAAPGEMVDLYCRDAISARTLLPSRRQLRWLGLDTNSERLAETRRQTPPSGRIRFAEASAERVPVIDGAMDVVLCVRGMGHFDPTHVIKEAARVLAPGGRILMVEADGLAETFVFDGHLVGYNTAFRALLHQVENILGILALGPRLGRLIEDVGFRDVRATVHAASQIDEIPFSKLARKLRRYPVAIARQSGMDASALLADIEREVSALERSTPHNAVGIGGTTQPLYLWSATRP